MKYSTKYNMYLYCIWDFALDFFARTSYFIMHINFAFFVADFVSRVDLRGIKMHLGRRPTMFQKSYCPLYLLHIANVAPPGFDCCNQSQSN